MNMTTTLLQRVTVLVHFVQDMQRGCLRFAFFSVCGMDMMCFLCAYAAEGTRFAWLRGWVMDIVAYTALYVMLLSVPLLIVEGLHDYAYKRKHKKELEEAEKLINDNGLNKAQFGLVWVAIVWLCVIICSGFTLWMSSKLFLASLDFMMVLETDLVTRDASFGMIWKWLGLVFGPVLVTTGLDWILMLALGRQLKMVPIQESSK